jgi:hypothetical protein
MWRRPSQCLFWFGYPERRVAYVRATSTLGVRLRLAQGPAPDARRSAPPVARPSELAATTWPIALGAPPTRARPVTLRVPNHSRAPVSYATGRALASLPQPPLPLLPPPPLPLLPPPPLPPAARRPRRPSRRRPRRAPRRPRPLCRCVGGSLRSLSSLPWPPWRSAGDDCTASAALDKLETNQVSTEPG